MTYYLTSYLQPGRRRQSDHHQLALPRGERECPGADQRSHLALPEALTNCSRPLLGLLRLLLQRLQHPQQRHLARHPSTKPGAQDRPSTIEGTQTASL